MRLERRSARGACSALGRFSEPSEIFGPVNLQKRVVETETAGMLPETDMAFLDEVFLGSTAILNTLLCRIDMLYPRTAGGAHDKS